jgi:hypothetical protein
MRIFWLGFRILYFFIIRLCLIIIFRKEFFYWTNNREASSYDHSAHTQYTQKEVFPAS